MEEVNSRPISFKWALIFAMTSLVYTLGVAIARVQVPQLLNWLIGVSIISLAFFMALKEYKTANEGQISFGKGFGMSMFIASVGGVIRAIVFYVYMTVDPEYLKFVQEVAQNNSFGPPPDPSAQEQMEGIMNFVMSAEFFSAVGFIMAILAGLILGAIVSAILKTEEEEF